MSRLLFFLAIIIVVYLLLKSFRRPTVKNDPTTAPPEEMVRCAQCGVHLPKSESITSGGNYYCSDEHRRKHSSK